MPARRAIDTTAAPIAGDEAEATHFTSDSFMRIELHAFAMTSSALPNCCLMWLLLPEASMDQIVNIDGLRHVRRIVGDRIGLPEQQHAQLGSGKDRPRGDPAVRHYIARMRSSDIYGTCQTV